MKRWIVLPVVAAAVVLSLGIAAPAQAADTGGIFDPSNFALSGDPTVASAAASGTALKNVISEGQLAGIALNKIRYAKGWTAITKRLGFGAAQITADADAATQVAQLERAYAPVATKFGPALKVVGGVASLAFAAQMGVSLGAGADRAVGIDIDHGLCSGADDGVFAVTAAILNFAGAADCAQYKMSQQLQAVLNQDAHPGLSGGPSCAADGSCVQLHSDNAMTFEGHDYHDFCFDLTGPSSNSAGYVQFLWSVDGSLHSTYINAPGYGCDFTTVGMQWRSPAGSVLDYYCVTSGADCTVGSKVVPSLSSADPPRRLRCDVTMADGSVINNSTAVFHESDRTIPPYVCPAVPAGAVPTKTTVWETGGSGGDIKWMDVPTTPEYQADRQAHPNCTLGQCRLELIRTADSLQCLDAGATCDGWFVDPDKTTKYSCQLGPDSMPLAKCNAYAPTFNAQKVAAGTPYADPTTGADVGQTVTQPGTDPLPTGLACLGSAWGAPNPVEWVLRPVVCAFQAAFVPSPTVIQASIDEADTRWKASSLGKLAGSITALTAMTLPTSGCSGISVPFPVFDMSGHMQIQTQHFLPACPGDFFAPWAPLFSVFIGGAFAVAGVISIKRLIEAFVGLNTGA